MQGHHAGLEPLLTCALIRFCAGLCVHMCFKTPVLLPQRSARPDTHMHNTRRPSIVVAAHLKICVQDMFSKAKHPERVFVGSVQQLATDIEEACWRPGKPAMPAISSTLRAKGSHLQPGHSRATLPAKSPICIVCTSHI